MPLFQYFGWVGSSLLAAFFAASSWLPGNLPDIESGKGSYCPQSVSQAARKKLTRSRTNFGTSF
jgi:hypothetical protein